MNVKQAEKALAELNGAFIEFIVETYTEGRSEVLMTLGVKQNDIELLRNITVETKQRMRTFPSPIVDISLNSSRLAMMVEYAAKETSNDQKIDELVRMGASQPMLEEIAAVSREEFRERRKRIGIDARIGRPQSLTDREMGLVNDSISVHQGNDLVEMYYRVGLETGLPLSQIWAYVREMTRVYA